MDERENSRKWCKKRGLEEQRFYEMTKLRRQFEDLLRESGLLEEDRSGTNLSSSERMARHGELKQLREAKRNHQKEVGVHCSMFIFILYTVLSFVPSSLTY